jgi:Tetracyclin repressor-like, C-terminal domain
MHVAAVMNSMRALTGSDFGPVIRALLSQIANNPMIGDPFRATVVQARRDEIAHMIARGIERGDLCPEADSDIATELLVGPVYFRLMFGGELDLPFAERVVRQRHAWMHGEPPQSSEMMAGGGRPEITAGGGRPEA